MKWSFPKLRCTAQRYHAPTFVSFVKFNFRKIASVLVVAVCFYFASFYIWDNYIGIISTPTSQKIDVRGVKMVRSNWATQTVRGAPFFVVRFISTCKKFPLSYKDYFFTSIENGCAKVQENPEEKRWVDPWGNPYQIRYDLERGKLQIRSQGRYLWWPLDDIVGETFFNGNSYKAQVEYCKSVPKDDMSCIFNRGWH